MANWLREQFCNLVYFTDFSVQSISLKKWLYSYSYVISFLFLWNVELDYGCLVQPKHVDFKLLK